MLGYQNPENKIFHSNVTDKSVHEWLNYEGMFLQTIVCYFFVAHSLIIFINFWNVSLPISQENALQFSVHISVISGLLSDDIDFHMSVV